MALEMPALDAPAEDWLVYADALQTAGDPRGEWIALVHEGSDEDREAYLARNAEALLGSVSPHRERVDVAWRWCVPEVVSIRVGPGDDGEALVDALLSSPLAGEMRHLRLVGVTPSPTDTVDLGPAVQRIVSGLPEQCTRLDLTDQRASEANILVSAEYTPGPNLVDFGPLEPVWGLAPLRALRIDVADTMALDLGRIDAPHLEELAIYGLCWEAGYDGPGEFAELLGQAKLPRLEKLALRLPETVVYSWPDQDGAYVPLSRYEEDRGDEYGDDGWNDGVNWSLELGPLFASLKGGPLKHLALQGFASPTQLLDALDVGGIVPQLEVLDLSQSDLEDAQVHYLRRNKDLFGGLRVLDLSDTLVNDPSPLADLGPEIRHRVGPGTLYEFSVGME